MIASRNLPLPQLAHPSVAQGNAENSVLDEVHSWLGLSLDFLNEAPKTKLPSIAEGSESFGGIAENAGSPGGPNKPSPKWQFTPQQFASFQPSGNVDSVVDGLGFNTPQFPLLSNYNVDSPIGLLELGYGLMLGPLLDDLLRLYFQNIHAYYPVIDEFDFEQSFSGFSDDGNLRQSRALVLTSMLLCASMYLNTNKSYGYGQWTQKKLQIAVFAATKDLYNAASETGNQTALTQACMLLSYWSPCYQEQAHINSAWLARAFVHAEAAGLREMTSETLTDRSRLIWCCCLVRDRIISYSSRRALNPMSSCTNGVRVSREDFGLEICMPRYSDPDSRNGLVDAFLLLCRLSEILADINEFEQKQRDGERKVGRKEVLRVSQFDIRLREWKRGFQIWKAGPKNSTIQDSRGSYYLRCVVSESSTATLYLPYIKPSGNGDLVDKFAITALAKVKAAAGKIADTVRDMLQEVRAEEMPPFMSVWLPLPIIALLIDLKFHHGPTPTSNPDSPNSAASPASSDSQSSGSPAPPATQNITKTRLRHLFTVLKLFRSRFRCGQFVLELVTDISQKLHLGMWDSTTLRVVADEDTSQEAGEKEWEVLLRASAMIDDIMRTDGSGSSDR